MSDKNNVWYGMIAGTFTAATLQPLDNIKMGLIVPPKQLILTRNFVMNVGLVTQYIYKEEGLRSFYKGLVSNVWKTGLSSAIYFYCLRALENAMKKSQIISEQEGQGVQNAQGRFLSSCTARVASSILTNPLGVVESRYEITGKEKWEGSVFSSLRKIYKIEGVKGLFQGGLATCYKQGSFAGLYYTLYQAGKSHEIPSMVAGLASGVISTFITHPFEIIRTNIQVYKNFHPTNQQKSANIYQQIVCLAKEGDLFKGVTPRLIKKPLANTLAFSIFECMESWSKGVQKKQL